MSDIADLRRLEEIVARLTGERAIRDEAISLVRQMIDAQATSDTATVWWGENGPAPGREYEPGKPLSPKPLALVDLTVNSEVLPVRAGAAELGVSPETLRRYVSRADTEMHNRGCKATIFISRGMVQTATTSIVVTPGRRDR
jgi:hypothetical protein